MYSSINGDNRAIYQMDKNRSGYFLGGTNKEEYVSSPYNKDISHWIFLYQYYILKNTAN